MKQKRSTSGIEKGMCLERKNEIKKNIRNEW